VPAYPSLSKREDTAVMRLLIRTHAYVMVSAPHLYIYTVTGHNTWDAAHMEVLLAKDAQPSSPAEYEAMFQTLNNQYQLEGYQDYCLQAIEGATSS
jgi:hypothetical protein